MGSEGIAVGAGPEDVFPFVGVVAHCLFDARDRAGGGVAAQLGDDHWRIAEPGAIRGVGRGGDYRQVAPLTPTHDLVHGVAVSSLWFGSDPGMYGENTTPI